MHNRNQLSSAQFVVSKATLKSNYVFKADMSWCPTVSRIPFIRGPDHGVLVLPHTKLAAVSRHTA